MEGEGHRKHFKSEYLACIVRLFDALLSMPTVFRSDNVLCDTVLQTARVQGLPASAPVRTSLYIFYV
jgi:hypothetical protein